MGMDLPTCSSPGPQFTTVHWKGGLGTRQTDQEQPLFNTVYTGTWKCEVPSLAAWWGQLSDSKAIKHSDRSCVILGYISQTKDLTEQLGKPMDKDSSLE